MEKIKHGFFMLTWGFIFTLLTFRLMGVDILPDIIGFIMIAAGLSSLTEYSPKFGKARVFTFPLIVYSIFTIYQAPNPVPGFHVDVPSTGHVLLSLVYVLLFTGMAYYIFKGVQELTLAQGNEFLSDQSRRQWLQLFVLQLFTVIGLLASLYGRGGGMYGLLVVLMLVYSIAVAVLVALFFHRCGQELTHLQ